MNMIRDYYEQLIAEHEREGRHELAQFCRDKIDPALPHPGFCRSPAECKATGRCMSDPICID